MGNAAGTHPRRRAGAGWNDEAGMIRRVVALNVSRPL